MYLGKHPQVFMNERVKEPHFFGRDLHHAGGQQRRRRSAEEYVALFDGATDEVWVGEGSTSYSYSESAASEIREFNSSARVVLMLRNPIDMMYSWHSYLLYTGAETLAFADALAAEDGRKRGVGLPNGRYLLEGLFYRKIACYADHLSRFVSVFGRDHVHAIIFDDFVQDTARTYTETLEFLGVDQAFQPSFERVNSNPTIRSTTLRTLVRRPPAILRTLARTVLTEQQLGRFAHTVMRTLNTTAAARRPMDPTLRRQLQSEFRPEVDRLGRMPGRDLSHWISDDPVRLEAGYAEPRATP